MTTATKSRPWTAEDQARAEVAAACGVGFREIGLMLGRPHSVVRRKLIPAAAEANREYHRRHHARNPERLVWQGVVRRCTDPAAANWPRYGGRGITVCDRWRESFYAFLQDMGPRTGPGWQIDRIDNQRGYEPENCRWTTCRENNRNTRRNRHVNPMGLRMTLAQACSITGVSPTTARKRLAAGLPPELAFSRKFSALPQAERCRTICEHRESQTTTTESQP